MKNKGIEKINRFVLVLDIICMFISYLFIAALRTGLLNGEFFTSAYGTALAITLGLYIITYPFHESNQENICRRGFYKEFLAVIRNHFMISLILMGYLLITRQSMEYSRFFFGIFLILNLLLTLVIRCYLKLILLLGNKKCKANNKVMVITLADYVDLIMRTMTKEYKWFVEVNTLAILDKDMVGSKVCDNTVKVNPDNLLEVVMDRVVDEVFIYLPYQYQIDLQNMITEFEKMGIVVHVNLDIHANIKTEEKKMEDFLGFPVRTFATKFFDEKQILLKRMLDIMGGLVGLFITGVFTLFVAPAVKLESKGPVFFSQIRVGKNGRKFKIYKFRSMYQDAELRKKELMGENEMDGWMFKMDNDPRVTKVGKFLRKTSLDEFPQFLNVLKGEMSLVGTRPPTVDEYEKYETLHRRRLSIKPGITGLWQTSGRSGITEFEQVLHLDLEYINHWSIRMDLKLLLKTIFVVVFQVGAK